jgi:ubiquinone biosynthesis monooxygenase Coq7
MQTANLLDTLIKEVDSALRTLLPPQKRTALRPSPAALCTNASLSTQEIKHVGGLMRVNHAGEVCAQALYKGQALTAQLQHIKKQMNQAALDEIDHLAWCEERLIELGSKPSIFNPLWYSGALVLGALAGLAGDGISLGFVAETERQVSAHLQKHLNQIPERDEKTKAIIKMMQIDEEHHATVAKEAGGVELPFFIQQLMSVVSKIMTKSSYYF